MIRAETPSTTVLIIDDHPFVRDGVAGVLAASGRYVVVGEAGSGTSGVARLQELKPQLVLVDLRLPDGDGLAVLEAVAEFRWGTYAVVLSAFETDDDLLAVARKGARAFLVKTSSGPELIGILDRVMAGEHVLLEQMPNSLRSRLAERDLTAKEVEVLRYLGQGYGNKRIAAVIGLSENTVKIHLRHIFKKLGISNRSEAVSVAIRRGLVD